jgi:membrane protein DedA with SNARE-associated domain
MSLMSFLTGLPAPAVYGTVAALVGVESIGIPVPGETALITGALIGSPPAATVSLLGVFLAAWLGAVAGDNIGYVVGRRHGAKLFARLGKRFPRQFSPAHLRYAEHLFDRYGTAAVFGGRFVALLRILAGPLAGSLHLPYARFLLANAAGAAVWAGAITALAGLLGAAAHTWIAGAGWALLLGCLVLGLVISRRVHRVFEDQVARYAAEHEAKAA